MRVLVLTCAVCALAAPALAGWVQLNSGTMTDLDGAGFWSSTRGCVTCGGHVMRTTDGGTTWDSLPGPNMFTLAAITFAIDLYSGAETTGYVVASGGKIAKSTDAGATWVRESSGVTVDLRAITWSHKMPVFDNTSYVCGGDGTEGVVLKTTDAGQTWVRQSVNPGHPIAAVDFPVEGQTGFASGWSGVLLKTTDGGAHWDSLSSGTTSDLVGISFPRDTLTGYVCGSGGVILKTTNGGATWVSEPTGVSDYLASVSFPTSETGYAAGASGTIIKTTNGGSTWVKQVSGTSYFLSAIQFPLNTQTGYAVGRNGVILKTTDGGAAVEETPSAEVRATNAGATVLHSLPTGAVVFDAMGRRAVSPKSGVYFVREQGWRRFEDSKVAKVLLVD